MIPILRSLTKCSNILIYLFYMAIYYSSLSSWPTATSFHTMIRALDELQELKPKEVGGDEPIYLQLLLKFEADLGAFQMAYIPFSSVEASKDVIYYDKLRDKSWRINRAYLKVMLSCPDAEKAAIAQQYYEIFLKYKDPTLEERNKESGILANLIEELEEIDEEDCKKIGYDIWLADFKAIHKAFLSAEAKRTKQKGEKELGIVQTTRKEAEKSFLNLLQVINAMILVEGEDKYASVANNINVIFDEVRAQMTRKATINANKKQEDELKEDDSDIEIEDTTNDPKANNT